MEEKEEEARMSMNIVETEGTHVNQDELKKLHDQCDKKEITFLDYVTRVRELGGDVLFGNVDVQAKKENCETIETMMNAYRKGEISLHKMRTKIEDIGGETTFWDWENDKNPESESHESKLGFTWNVNYNKKGRFLQQVTKRVMIKMAEFVYKAMLKYDKAAFTFSDPRLLYLRNSVEKYITGNLSVEYKKDFVRKATDAVLFMMKEDVYYRVLVLKMINETPREFEISDLELSFFDREVPKE